MRAELEQIESIERYLEGKMSDSELHSFESKMQADTHLRQDVLQQEMMVGRIQTIGKMQAVALAHENHVKRAAYKGWAIKGLIGVTAVGAAIAGGKVMADWNNSDFKGEESAIVLETDETPKGEANAVLSDTISYSNGLISEKEIPDKTKRTAAFSDQKIHEQEDTLKSKSEEQSPEEGKAASAEKEEKESSEKSQKTQEGFRMEGSKMHLVSDDVNAKTHFDREVGIYDTWIWVESKEQADYTVKLRYKKQGLDRLSWIEIIDPSGKKVYRSIQSRGINGGMRTVNFKQASIEQLVHEILAYEFFGMD